MRRRAAAQAAPAAPARVEFDLRIDRAAKGRQRVQGDAEHGVDTAPALPAATPDGSISTVPTASTVPDVPPQTRLLVVAYWWERLIAEGRVKDYAEIARLTGLSRARVTQVTSLVLLPRTLQELRLQAE